MGSPSEQVGRRHHRILYDREYRIGNGDEAVVERATAAGVDQQ
jgi:hypothetical protein